MVRCLVCAVVCALLLLVPAAFARANDDFADARFLPFGTTDTGDNTTATTQPGETLTAMGAQPFCDVDGTLSQTDRTLWWWITGTGRPITVTTAESDFDTHLGIFEGPLDGGVAYCQDGDATESITFPSTPGKTYRIQAGGCATNSAVPCALERSGHLRVFAYSPPPANDSRARAARLERTATGDNYAANEDERETLTCAGRAYGRTVWYRWSAPSDGSATFALSHPGGALAVYGPDGTLARCDTHGGDERVGIPVSRGDYLVQVGGLGAHNGMASDSAQGPFTLTASFTAGDPGVGGRGRTPYPAITSRARLAVALFARWSRIRGLSARNVPAGAKVQVRCSGRSCPFRRTRARTIRRRRSSVSLLTASLRAKRIVPTTTIEVRVTRAGHIGSVTRFRFNRLRRGPVQEVRCLVPGRSTPQKTC